MPTLPTRCTVCGKSAPEVSFYNSVILRRCKTCHKRQCNERRWKKKEDLSYCEELKSIHKKYWLDNRERLRKYNREIYLKRKEELRIAQLETPHKEKTCGSCGEVKTVCDFYLGLPRNCKECERKRSLALAKKNYPAWISKPENREKKKTWTNNYKENNLNYKIASKLRTRMFIVIRRNGATKLERTFPLLGCSIEQFRKHIESQFKDGMNWDNYGKFGWHLDHIKACANFDLTKIEEQRKCFHFTNFQPLWWRDNLSKGKKS